MIDFDEKLFGSDVFTGLSDEEKGVMLNQLYETLQMRLGQRIADELNEEQLTEFTNLKDEDARQAWLEKAMPDFNKVVEEEVEILRGEVRNIAKRAGKVDS